MSKILLEVQHGAEFTLLPRHPGCRAILALPGFACGRGRVLRCDADSVVAAVAGIVRQLEAGR